MANPNPSNANPKRWRWFIIPLLIQLGIISSITAQASYTYFTGKTVMLKTLPIDPYGLLTGYSQTLSYEISNLNTIKKLPGWKTIKESTTAKQTFVKPGIDRLSDDTRYRGLIIYVVLEASDKPDAPWQAVDVFTNQPQNLKPNQIALKGTVQDITIRYNLETYYMPEDQREEVNEVIGSGRKPAIVETRIDAQGNAVPVKIKVGDRTFAF
jgi:uncharacterized membrane-anchored protein